MSTQPELTPQWKEEVNRRLAAHKSRRAQSSSQESAQQAGLGASRAAEAAARVAARYAKAPTYSQMQAEEARVAVRAAEIATKVALDAQAVAETALAGLHAATQEQPPRRSAVVQPIAAPSRIPEVAPVVSPSPAGVPTAAQLNPTVEAAPLEPVPQAELPPPAERRVFGIRWDPDLPVRPAEKKAGPSERSPGRVRALSRRLVESRSRS